MTEIDWTQKLAEKLTAWHDDPNLRRFDDDPTDDEAVLVLTAPADRDYRETDAAVGKIELTRTHLRELSQLLERARYANQAAKERRERVKAMARVMVDARRAGEDVGELVGAAAQKAAGPYPAGGMGDRAVMSLGAFRLIQGRPGSWEASLLYEWAQAGGAVGNQDFVDQLERLMQEMAQARDDGGDVLSQAMGLAVDELESMAAFAAGSTCEGQLRNIGGQYARVGDV